MNVRKVEQLLTELLDAPTQPLNESQLELAFEFADGLFAGHVDSAHVAVDLTFGEVQAAHVLAQKLTFYLEYFTETEEGRADAVALGLTSQSVEQLALTLLDVERTRPTDELKQASERSSNWSRGLLVDQLSRPNVDDLPVVSRLTVNYEPTRLLAKAEAVAAYREFFAEVLRGLGGEPDERLADAKRALIHVYAGRLDAMAAVDIYPGLLSLEEQLTRSNPSEQVAQWEATLSRLAPALGRIHSLEGDERKAARETYAKHLDAIRQGAPLEIDEVNEQEAGLFVQQALAELSESVQIERAASESAPTDLARELEGVTWDAEQIKQLVEAVLREWGVLSDQAVTWQEVDDREGFAPDEKFQVIVTPRRKNMSVDSTRRIVNIPEDTVRPLIGLYPAGALPLVAHELSHVLQAYADYELGQQIPLARIKGRRYRILREAGGAYQEKVLCRDYLGLVREPNLHYLVAYAAKVNGGNRLQVARAFYESLVEGKDLAEDELQAARELAVNRSARLYRYGGHSSQALDYVEQSVVCGVLMERLSPEQVDAFLLGSASFSLEDSALLHRFGLLTLPATAAYSPAHDVMRVFDEQFRPL
ncbi:MAG TPA: hypothetical protein VJM46_01800 [Candidatus Saccharimonadales bacterium]|nr:hypothetical protein [Candidatus Saccharimonadales bacterium]